MYIRQNFLVVAMVNNIKGKNPSSFYPDNTSSLKSATDLSHLTISFNFIVRAPHL